MNNILKVKQEQLGDRLGKIVPWDYKPLPGEYVFTAYILDNIPIRICSELTHEEFKKIC
ncbi:hypothetical protein [Clostridium kluyveri]|uniref:hypothetical protein n=1 Tax=Clostridium kluyveri TaxID=1534 RepID=UPI0012EB6A60|nr:hypothetical protein [Clostridium kluyveri]